MKNFILFLNLLLSIGCSSQNKISFREMNDDLLKNNHIYYDVTYKDPVTVKGIKNTLSKYRLSGLKSCNINPDKKYPNIYIEDGFHDEKGFYNGMIIMDNKNICEITTSPYKLQMDSLSYNRIKENNFVFYTKKVPKEEFKKKYPDEYFRYELVIQNKVEDFNKCLAIDHYTPKSVIYAKNYFFSGGKLFNYESIQIKYTDIKDGVIGIPYFKEEKKKEFIDCINNLNILKFGK
ncbi:hypothetical protein ABID31_001861 [Chryseobacterium flavum]|nr:hypothetical protein [Chryseobacterium flavum]